MTHRGSRWKLLGYTQRRSIIGLCHLPPRLENQSDSRKSKTSVRKKSDCEPDLQKKNLWVRMKIASLGGDLVFTGISILCSIIKCKCLWRGRLVMVIVATNFEYSPKSGFMTYFHMKPLLSHPINPVRVQVSFLYRLNICAGLKTFGHYSIASRTM